MNTASETTITDPAIVFYGPHPCDLCGSGPIVRGSVERGFGNIRLSYPNEAIYPNHKWEAHECSCGFQIGQHVEWDGQDGVYFGKISDILIPSPGTYVLRVGDFENGFLINAATARPMSPIEPLTDGDDKGLDEFRRDSAALKTKKTKVEHKWTAWLSDRENGIIGTGETESEAIKALAAQYRDKK